MSLTDDWKAGKLKPGSYWIKDNEGNISCDDYIQWVNNNDEEKERSFLQEKYIKEILAPCDYDHFAELSKKVEAQNEEIQGLKNGIDNYQLLIDRLESSNEKLGITLEHLRDLLKDCKEWFECFAWNKEYKHKSINLLTRINAVIERGE